MLHLISPRVDGPSRLIPPSTCRRVRRRRVGMSKTPGRDANRAALAIGGAWADF